MGFFSTTQKALAAGRTVFYGELYRLSFTSGARHYWDGFGSLSAYSQTWAGVPGIVARSEIPFGIDDEAGKLTLTLPGIDDEILAKVASEEAEIFGREITIWGQFFGESLGLSDTRFQLFVGKMDVPTYVRRPGENTVEIPCEGEWADRGNAPFSFFSDRDQQARFAGDRGLEFIVTMNNIKLPWPSL